MNNDIPIDITKLPVVSTHEYVPRQTWADQKPIEPESPAIAEVNRRMEQWMKEQYASFWRDGEVVRQPQNVQIFLATKEQIADVFAGKIKATNIPKGAWLYDIRCWESSQIMDTYAFWMVHPDFPEYRSGTCAPAYPMIFE